VFQIGDDRQTDKVTHGPYEWGQNAEQFAAIGRIRAFAEQIWPEIVGKETRWLAAPGSGNYLAWTHVEDTGYVFAASMTGHLPDDLAPGEVVFEEGGCRILKSERMKE
jgi:hypothetical protein